MPSAEGGAATSEPKRAKQEGQPAINLNLNLSPSARLDSMTQGRIDALERDKQEIKTEVIRLQLLLDQIAPRNARLEEALGNAESNNVASTILIGVGGFLVSYATFTGKAAERWANVAAGCLLAGIGLMIWQSFRRWRRN